MIDWPAIRAEYVGGNASTRELAQKHGVSYSTLQKRCRADGWAAEREAMRGKAAAEWRQKTAEGLVSARLEHTRRLVALADRAMAALEARLDAMDEHPNAYEIKAVVEAALKIRDIYEAAGDGQEETKSDGLMEALDGRVLQLFAAGDDSAMLPEEEEMNIFGYRD